MREVRTQAELDKALTQTNQGRDELIVCMGAGPFTVRDSATVQAGGSATVEAGGSATVEAWGSATVRASGSATVEAGDSATVRAWDSATVRAWDSASVHAWDSATVQAGGSATVEAWGSATVQAAGDSATVCAWGSATVRASGSATVEAWGSATVQAWGSATVQAAGGSATVEAWGSATVQAGGSATVRAWGSATVEAGGSATVEGTRWTPVIVNERTRENVTISGGQVIEIPIPKTPEEWCEFHGVEVADGIATLFKAVDAEWRSLHKTPAGEHITYAPGETPEAPDWDGGEEECGGGLHLSPSPVQARSFHPAATRFVACPVHLSEIAIHPEGTYPEKCKAARVTDPGCWEVTIDGEAVDA